MRIIVTAENFQHCISFANAGGLNAAVVIKSCGPGLALTPTISMDPVWSVYLL